MKKVGLLLALLSPLAIASSCSDPESGSKPVPDADAGGAGGHPAPDAANSPDGADATDAGDTTDATDAADGSDAADGFDGSACAPVVEEHASEGALHVATCSPVTYASNPPSSGNHYPIWAAFQSFAEPVPRGFYVHDLEHGAVVITYNCLGGCPAEVAAAQSFIDSLAADPACGDAGPPRIRVVLTPDPLLDVRWAASAWLWTLKAPCFDPAAFGQFVTDHYAKAPEDECANGIDPTANGGLCADAGDASTD